VPGPLVSAIVLAFDCERYVGEAIDSVRAQTHENVELLFIDNGSSDGTREVAASKGAEIAAHIEPNRGICPGRNVGLALARGEFIGFLDGDDLWAPDKIERQLAVLNSDPAPDFVLGQVSEFASPELGQEAAASLPVRPEPREGQVVSAMLAPRRTWNRVGPWTEEYVHADGLDWFLRAERAGMRGAQVDRVVLQRRIHGQNTSLVHPEAREEWTRLLKDRLDERRLEAS
jgi:glycosyltransferase involved in cell wall biosynthesis